MRIGDGAVKTGKGMPSPIQTVALAIRALFFSEKALYAIFLNNSHTLNLVCFYIVLLFVPYKDFDGVISPDNSGRIIESFVLTSVFISLLFIYLPKKLAVFSGFVRLMFAFEATSLLLPLTFLINAAYIKYFIPFLIAWYLSLAVFAVAKIKGIAYWLSAVIVIGTFTMTLFLPAFFQA